MRVVGEHRERDQHALARAERPARCSCSRPCHVPQYFASKSCMKEVLWATCLRIPIVLLLNAEEAKGGLEEDL